MKNKNRFLAAILAGATAVTGIVVPEDALKAEEFANIKNLFGIRMQVLGRVHYAGHILSCD